MRRAAPRDQPGVGHRGPPAAAASQGPRPRPRARRDTLVLALSLSLTATRRAAHGLDDEAVGGRLAAVGAPRRGSARCCPLALAAAAILLFLYRVLPHAPPARTRTSGPARVVGRPRGSALVKLALELVLRAPRRTSARSTGRSGAAHGAAAASVYAASTRASSSAPSSRRSGRACTDDDGEVRRIVRRGANTCATLGALIFRPERLKPGARLVRARRERLEPVAGSAPTIPATRRSSMHADAHGHVRSAGSRSTVKRPSGRIASSARRAHPRTSSSTRATEREETGPAQAVPARGRSGATRAASASAASMCSAGHVVQALQEERRRRHAVVLEAASACAVPSTSALVGDRRMRTRRRSSCPAPTSTPRHPRHGLSWPAAPDERHHHPRPIVDDRAAGRGDHLVEDVERGADGRHPRIFSHCRRARG